MLLSRKQRVAFHTKMHVQQLCKQATSLSFRNRGKGCYNDLFNMIFNTLFLQFNVTYELCIPGLFCYMPQWASLLKGQVLRTLDLYDYNDPYN